MVVNQGCVRGPGMQVGLKLPRRPAANLRASVSPLWVLVCPLFLLLGGESPAAGDLGELPAWILAVGSQCRAVVDAPCAAASHVASCIPVPIPVPFSAGWSWTEGSGMGGRDEMVPGGQLVERQGSEGWQQ